MNYELTVETYAEQNAVRLRLSDENEQFLAHQEIRLSDHPASYWEGLFDTRRHVERFEGSLLWENAKTPETAEQILNRLGVFLGTQVLGQGIFAELTRSKARRTLLIRVPSAKDNALAAAFARIPWEIARITPEAPALMERSLVVRVVSDDAAHDPAVIEAAKKDLAKGDHLKVLMVYAEAPGSRPLAMRQERDQLLGLFHTDILPRKRVHADVLCHGVTLSVLKEKITSAGGYHIVHWSGHGHHNLLEIQGENGGKHHISGEELVAIFEEAGGFIPQIVFLSACLSGTFVDIQDWKSFHAAVMGKKQENKQTQVVLPQILENPAGYTGTALELLRAGVPQVIAMRYEVGDDYARELARQFFKRLLADPAKMPTEGALASARSDLLRDKKLAGQLGAINHATPLMFGIEGRIPEPADRRSDQMKRLHPFPTPLLHSGSHELDKPSDFVGRGSELTQLNTQWLPHGSPPVAIIQGLAGMGKTALAAEAIHLWHSRFDYVLAFQAKPAMLNLDDTLRQISDGKLGQFSQPYQEKCNQTPMMRVFLDHGAAGMKPDQRYERMRHNLLEAMRDEAILLVLDNFETNLSDLTPRSPLLKGEGMKADCSPPRSDLTPRPTSLRGNGENKESSPLRSGEGLGVGFISADPRWDQLLAFLTREMKHTRSRLLITSRHLPSVLADNDGVVHIPLGTLASPERGLYIRSHPKLRELLYSDKQGEELVRSLLLISRGHPLIMNRLAAIADDRGKLKAALDTLREKGMKGLPDLFAPMSETDKAKERAYLEDAAIGSVDFLIAQISENARKLLWVMTQANEPIPESIIEGVWSGKSVEDEQLEQLRMLIRLADQLPEELRKQLSELPPEIMEMLKTPADTPESPPIQPLLRELTRTGLISREESGEEKTGSAAVRFAFHELVRERMSEWMNSHESERGGKTEDQIRIAIGERYEAMFQQLQLSGQENAMESASEAGRRALVYFVRARAFDKLSGFASGLVTSTRDPALLRGVIAELQAVADIVPAGRDRWTLRTNIADALDNAGQSDKALPFFEQACAEAEAAENWSAVGWICANWAGALMFAGQSDKSKETHLRSADAYRKAGSPQIDIIGRELEAFRIDIKQGKAQEVLPEIEARLTQIRDWFQRRQNGETTPDAPDPVFLGRVLIGGLDIAKEAYRQIENWEACLSLLKETEQAKRSMGASKHELYRTRFNQYGPLMELGRLDEAQKVVEDRLAVGREVNDLAGQSKALSALADIWDERGDIRTAIGLAQQALSICNQLPDPAERGISHCNLGSYLRKAGKLEEAKCHDVADIIYCLVSQQHQSLSHSLNNLRIRMNRAAQSSTRYELPRISSLLALPEFEALKRFLEKWGVDVGALQGEVDEVVAGLNR